MTEENTVFIGKKSAMAYVLAAVMQINQGSKEVTLKARGKAISRAVDVAEILRNKFIKELRVDKIDISTEDIITEDDNTLKVSSIEIRLSKS